MPSRSTALSMSAISGTTGYSRADSSVCSAKTSLDLQNLPADLVSSSVGLIDARGKLSDVLSFFGDLGDPLVVAHGVEVSAPAKTGTPGIRRPKAKPHSTRRPSLAAATEARKAKPRGCDRRSRTSKLKIPEVCTQPAGAGPTGFYGASLVQGLPPSCFAVQRVTAKAIGPLRRPSPVSNSSAAPGHPRPEQIR